MPFRRPLLALALCAAWLALPAGAAVAGVFPGEVIDGPSPDVLSVGGLDVARDGTGAVVYVRRDGGVEHVFASRLVDGAWQPPERLDGSIAAPGATPVVAAGNRGRLLAAWVSDGTLFASVRRDAASPWGAPQPLAAPAEAPVADLDVNGHAYLVWTSAGDVHAARLERGGTRLRVLGAPLDLNPADPAGDAPGRRPSVAIAADGVGLVAFGEVFPDGRSHVVERRLLGMAPSTVPQDLTLDQLDGRPGGDADDPVAGIEEDSSFGWVAFREAFADGDATVTRAVARRMRGTRFDPPVAIDGQGFPAEPVGAPSLAVDGSAGVAAVGRASGVVLGAGLSGGAVAPVQRIDSAPSPPAVAPGPVTATDDGGDALVAWPFGTPGSPSPDAQLRGRELVDGRFGPEAALTNPALGAVDVDAGIAAAADRALDVAVVAIQNGPQGRSLVAAMADRDPSRVSARSSSGPLATARPVLRWSAPLNLWGGLSYAVEVDGRVVARTGRLSLRAPRLSNGVHHWRVVATDRRGQSSASRTLPLDVDVHRQPKRPGHPTRR